MTPFFFQKVCSIINGTPDTATIGIWLDGVNESTGCETPPTISPAPTPQFKEVQYVGNPCTSAFPVTGKCAECTGDCDDDSDCEDGLVCFQRSYYDTDVPGCVWGTNGASLIEDNSDYCEWYWYSPSSSIFYVYNLHSLNSLVCINRHQAKYRVWRNHLRW